MKQDIAYTMNGVASTASTAIAGVEAHGDDIDIKHCTAPVLAAFRLAAITARLLYDNAKEALRGKRSVYELARDAARKLATVARDNLKPIFGSEYQSSWDGPGFYGSLAIPMTYEDLLAMLEALIAFFTANPTLEVPNRGVTAANLQVVCTALKDAFKDVTEQETTMALLLNDRNTKFDLLRDKLVLLVDELTHLIDPLDPRWKAFGLNVPGAEETPDAPANIVALLIGSTTAALKWDAAARAEYYRVWKKVIGVDADAIAVGSPGDIDFTLENLPANVTVEIYVSAVNSGGESQLSEKVTITTH